MTTTGMGPSADLLLQSWGHSRPGASHDLEGARASGRRSSQDPSVLATRCTQSPAPEDAWMGLSATEQDWVLHGFLWDQGLRGVALPPGVCRCMLSAVWKQERVSRARSWQPPPGVARAHASGLLGIEDSPHQSAKGPPHLALNLIKSLRWAPGTSPQNRATQPHVTALSLHAVRERVRALGAERDAQGSLPCASFLWPSTVTVSLSVHNRRAPGIPSGPQPGRPKSPELRSLPEHAPAGPTLPWRHAR